MQAPQEPDAALVSRARAGDTRALGALYERHSPRVEQVVRKYVWNDDHADLVHDTFVKAIEHLPAAREDTDFRNWIGRIAERTALDYLRSAHFRKSRAGGLPSDDPYENLLAHRLEQERDPYPLPEEALLAQERAALALELLADARPHELAMVGLTADGYGLKEIGRHLTRPTTTLKPALFRLRATLARRIGADPERYGPLDTERAARALESKLSAIRQRRPTAQPTSLSEGDS